MIRERGNRILFVVSFLFFALWFLSGTSAAAEELDIVSVTPDKVRNDGGEIVTIRGTGFMKGMKIYFNDVPVDSGNISIELSDTGYDTAEVITPGGNTGYVKIRVEDPNDPNKYDVLLNAFWYQSTPEITDVTPNQGTTIGGTTITISGSEFGEAGTMGNEVELYIGSTLVENVSLISPTEISAVTPPGTLGSKSITIVNADGGSYTVPSTSDMAFTYIPSNPGITSIAPDYGPTIGGTEIAINGTEFSTEARVKVGDHWAQEVTYVSRTKLTAVVPSSETTGFVDVVVENPDGQTAVLQDSFEYISIPIIDNITPNYGLPGEDRTGNPIIITGTNFNTTVGAAVYFGGKQAEATVVSSTRIEVTKLPDLTPGTVHVKVVNLDDTREQFTLENGFTFQTVQSSPVIASIVPNAGSTEEYTDVTIYGEQLLTGARLFVGNEEVSLAEANFVSTGEVHVSIPPSGTAGSKDVRWVNYDGGEFILEDGFTHIRPEEQVKITSITPDRGAEDENTPITINGVNFANPSDEDFVSCEVTIGNIPVLDLQWIDSRTLKAKTPLGYVKEGETETSWDVTIVQAVYESGNLLTQKYTLTGGFTYVLPASDPSIAEIYDREMFQAEHVAVDSGPLAGGNEVVIVGTDFRTQAGQMPKVEFGSGFEWSEAEVLEVITLDPGQAEPDYNEGLPGYVEGEKETAIIAVVPPGTETGSVDVKVTNPDLGTAVLLNGWIYKTCNLAITSITPDTGPVTGGIEAVISGANFTEDYRVWIKFVHEYEDGSKDTTVVEEIYEIRDTTVRFLLPPSIIGVKDVVVYDRFGERSLEDGFTYYAPKSSPVITSVTPGEGSAAGGDLVVIEGEDFRPGAAVTIGGAAAEVVSIEWDTLEVITPPGEPGYQDITVANTDGGRAVMEDGFKYISYPTIDSVQPGVVNSSGGTIVTITGTQFYEGARVFFRKVDEIEAPEVKVVDNNTVRARVPEVSETGYYDVILRNPDYDADLNLGETVLEDGLLYEEPPEALPVVEAVYPDTAPTTGGIRVVVEGQNIDPDAKVYFGLEEAQVLDYLGDGRIQVVVPPNEEGSYRVTVTNPDGGTGVSGEAIFEYREAATSPAIISVSPNIGSVDGGTYVTIRGTDFRTGAEVYFGSEPAGSVTVTLEDPANDIYKITCVTPRGEIGYVDVIVFNPDNSFGIAVLEDGFEYRRPDSSPVIASVTPPGGPTTGGTKVTVKGNDFRTGVKVYFDGIPAAGVKLVDARTITAEAPPHKAGKVPVTVVNYDGASFTFGDSADEEGFTYAVPGSKPEVHSIDPEFGFTWKETWVTIYGLDFRVNPEVYFGSLKSSQVEYVDYQTIRALAPAQEEGTVDVTVVNEDYGTGTLKNAFTYRSSAPKIDYLNPNMGDRNGGDVITIFGKEFVVEYIGESLSIAPAVYFEQGELEAEVEVLPGSSSTVLKVITPPAPGGVIGFYDVRVVNPDGPEALLKKGFKYTVSDSKPTIALIEPSRGSVEGGTPIKIYGSDFREGIWVFIGGKEAAGVELVDSSTIRAVTPPHTPGAKDVTVVNYDGGSATLEGGFTYEVPLSEPVIDKVEPNKGPHIGGTEITVTGRDFREGVSVYIGGEPCSDITRVDYKTITAVTPPGEVGKADVTVINSDLGSATLEDGFTYIFVEIPEITSVSPSQGPTTGGTEIVISGSKFQKGARVTIGGAEAVVIEVSEAEIKAATPEGEAGWQEVVVINPDGGRSGLANGFYYFRPRTEPDTPGWLNAYRYDEHTIKLTWGEAEFANYFEIYMRESGKKNFQFVDQTKSNVHEYYVTDLKPDTLYYFQVRAVNELGLSEFTETDSARTAPGESNYEEEGDETARIEFGQGAVVVSVPGKKALEEYNYVIDFSGVRFGNAAVKTLQLNADAARDLRRDINIKLDDADITLPYTLWNLPEINNLKIYERKRAVVRFVVTDAGQREAESALRYIPRGANIVSRAYAVHIEVQSPGMLQRPELFPAPVEISFNLRGSAPNSSRFAIYKLDAGGKWYKASNIDHSWSKVSTHAYQPATFILVYK